MNTTVTNFKSKTFPTPIGIAIIAVWGAIVVCMLLFTIKTISFNSKECIVYNETGCSQYK